MSNRPKIAVAAAVLVYLNGKLFGRCTSFSWTSATPHREVRVIDTQHPIELASTTVSLKWNMGVLRTVGDGGLQGAGVVAQQTDLSREKYFTIQLVERRSGLTLFRSDLCNTDTEAWSVTAKGSLAGNASGSGILWVNEASST